MEPDEIEQLLIKTARLTEENHRILSRMQKAERLRAYMRFGQIVLMVSAFALLYYLIQPRIVDIKLFIESAQSLIQQQKESSIYEIINSLQETEVTPPSSTEGSDDLRALENESNSGVELEEEGEE